MSDDSSASAPRRWLIAVATSAALSLSIGAFGFFVLLADAFSAGGSEGARRGSLAVLLHLASLGCVTAAAWLLPASWASTTRSSLLGGVGAACLVLGLLLFGWGSAVLPD